MGWFGVTTDHYKVIKRSGKWEREKESVGKTREERRFKIGKEGTKGGSVTGTKEVK